MLKGVKPPLWAPTFTSLTHTSHCQSTAPKFSITSFPFHDEGTVKERSYHNAWSAPTVLPTPDRLDSTAKGTRISPSHFFGLFSPAGTMAYCHRPFRFFQSLRSIIGRGYSPHTFSTSIVSAQGVLMRSPAGCHPQDASAIAANAAARMLLYFILKSVYSQHNLPLHPKTKHPLTSPQSSLQAS